MKNQEIHPNVVEFIQTLDAFIFEPGGKLDCYQRLEYPEEVCEIASGSGLKTVFLVANSRMERYDWGSIRTLGTIADICVNLEDETKNSPVLTYIQESTAGDAISPALTPLRSEIVLRSLKCNFSGRPYSGEKLTDVKAYLTYVNASCSLIPEDRIMPSRIINAGWLNPYDLARFKEPELIMKDLAIDIGNSSITINHSFFCYGNGHDNESIGSPFTRLVIEGKIGRDTYYYPIRINPQNGGIKRASRYIYDVTIRRAGATHPDGSLDDTDIDINVGIEVWQEKEWQNIRY